MTLEEIYQKVREGVRISREEGLFLVRNAELLDLGDIANEIRINGYLIYSIPIRIIQMCATSIVSSALSTGIRVKKEHTGCRAIN